MATKSAGIPSETASSASPRYLRTLDPCSISFSSRPSRIASAISVGVISSSPAPSATSLTSAIAFRIRSAAARPGMGSAVRRLAGSDHDPAIGLLADAGAADVRIVLQGEVDCAPLERLHGVQRDRVAGHLHLPRRPQGDLAHGVLAALAVSLDVDDHALALSEMLANHDVGHRLQRAQRLTSPADQCAEVATADIERDGIGAGANSDLRAHAHKLQQSLNERARDVGLAVALRARSYRRGSGQVDHTHLDHGLLMPFADHAHVHVATALAKLDQGCVDRFVE